jgi:hypothetical protein
MGTLTAAGMGIHVAVTMRTRRTNMKTTAMGMEVNHALGTAMTIMDTAMEAATAEMEAVIMGTDMALQVQSRVG